MLAHPNRSPKAGVNSMSTLPSVKTGHWGWEGSNGGMGDTLGLHGREIFKRIASLNLYLST